MPRCGSSQFQKSFAARTITEKNSLPDSITLLATVPSFRSQLSAISCLQACTLHCCNIHNYYYDNYHLDPDYRSLLLSTDGNDRKIDMLCDLASSNSCCLHHRRTSQGAGGRGLQPLIRAKPSFFGQTLNFLGKDGSAPLLQNIGPYAYVDQSAISKMHHVSYKCLCQACCSVGYGGQYTNYRQCILSMYVSYLHLRVTSQHFR